MFGLIELITYDENSLTGKLSLSQKQYIHKYFASSF